MRTRLIVRKAVLGDLSVINDPDIWLCTTCYQCYERCPRDIKPTDIIIELRNMAVSEGIMSPAHRKTVEFLKTTGHGVPINDQVKKQRKELGLDELPPTIYKYKDEADSELKKMAENLFNLPLEKKKEVKADEKKTEEKK